MQLSVFAAVFIGVGLISSSASAASLTVGLSSTASGTTYGTSPATPLIVVPEKSSVSGSGNVYTMSALMNSQNEGTFNNVTFAVTLPPGVLLDQTFAGSFTFVSCANLPYDQPRTCTWTRPSMPVAGASGNTVGVSFKAVAVHFRDGQNFQLTATLSAASFTPVGGGSQPVTPGSGTFYAQASTIAGLSAVFGQNAAEITASGWGYGPDGVTNGHLSVHGVNVTTLVGPAGFTQNTIDDVSVTISLPAGSVFTALHMPTVPAGWTLTQPTPGELVLDWNDNGETNPWRIAYPALAASGVTNTYSAGQRFQIVAFAPCDRFDDNTAQPDIQVSGTVLARNAAGVAMTQVAGSMGAGVVNTTTANATFLPVWANPATPPSAPNWCVDTANPPANAIQGGSFVKSDGQAGDANTALAGVGQAYVITLRRPVGEPRLEDVFVVDRLPTGLWSPAGGAVVVSAPAPLIVYACDFSSLTEELGPAEWTNFEPDEVDPSTDPFCDPISLSGTPAVYVIPSGTTHLITTADQLGASPGTPWAGLNTIVITVTVTFPVGFVGTGPNNEARNQAWVFGGYTAGATPKVMVDLAGSLEDYATDGVVDATYSDDIDFNEGNENNVWDWSVLSPVVRGDALPIVVRQPVANIIPDTTPIAVALPTEAPISYHVVFPFNGIAPVVPTSPTFSVELPAGMSVVNATFIATPGASSTGITIYGTCDTPATPPVFSQSGTTLTWTSTDAGYTLNDPAGAFRYCAAIALELAADPGFGFEDGDLVTFTSRLVNGGGALLDSSTTTRPLGLLPEVSFGADVSCGPVGTIHATARIENNGGQPFTTVTSQLAMPQSVNQAAVIASIQPGLLGTYDSATFGPPSGGEVVLSITWTAPPALPPFTTDTFTIDVPWGGGSFTLVASGSVVATDLNGVESPPIPTTSAELRTIDACPGQVIVTKTFGAGGPAMAGVSFTLVGPGVDVTRSTNASGVVVFGDLAAGSYALSEDIAGLPGTATWTSTLAPATNVVVTSFGTTSVGVVNTCNCNDSNACTVDAPCTIDGVCSRSALDCSGTSVGACEAVACDPEDGCVGEPELPAECAPPQNGWIFYVALAGTPAKQLRCVVYDSQPTAAPTCAIIDGNQCGN